MIGPAILSGIAVSGIVLMYVGIYAVVITLVDLPMIDLSHAYDCDQYPRQGETEGFGIEGGQFIHERGITAKTDL